MTRKSPKVLIRAKRSKRTTIKTARVFRIRIAAQLFHQLVTLVIASRRLPRVRLFRKK